jgi:pyridoxamine 5'-phosphate oxidase
MSRKPVFHSGGSDAVDPARSAGLYSRKGPDSLRRGYRRRVIREEVARLRNEYESIGLDGPDMAEDPITEFQEWFAGALTAGIHEPNAFVLATVDADGSPSARALLMKDLSDDGIVFYTGMSSRKSQAMKAHPVAAATFVWTPLHRQVRFEGDVSRVSDEDADEYFSSRPRGAQIAAHASVQSSVVADRDELDGRFAELEAELGDDVPRPDHWGGWLLTPRVVEFWQGRPNRFHDRIRFRRDGIRWVKERLAP